MTGLVPIRALALGAPGREPDLTGRPPMTAPQAGVEGELQGLHDLIVNQIVSFMVVVYYYDNSLSSEKVRA